MQVAYKWFDKNFFRPHAWRSFAWTKRKKKKWKRKHKQEHCCVQWCEAGTSVCQYVWVRPCRRRSGVTEQADKQAASLASAATRLSRHTTRLGAAYHSAHTRGTQWALSPAHHAPAAAAMRNIHTGTKGSGAGRGGAADLGGEQQPRRSEKAGLQWKEQRLVAKLLQQIQRNSIWPNGKTSGCDGYFLGRKQHITYQFFFLSSLVNYWNYWSPLWNHQNFQSNCWFTHSM